ncbi:helix-turn-helix transcriptional regulator [Leucobacter celer]|uniref:helix-turn-helix transcriptional regulator n=1 Tax=Leucobacter celer TaxID=668625 RepID=UPI0027BAECF6|nr:AraC family transcriptional regulator [Leucobacter celer]
MVDLVFWQHSAQFNDRRDATEYLDINYAEPAQVVRIGIDRARLLAPWLDDLAKLSEEGLQPACFYRAQSLLSSILDVVVPHIVVTGQRVTSTQRHTVVPSAPRHRDFQPLRSEARKIAEILASELHRRWSVPELASVVHLSPSQLRRVFSDAYGKAPIAYLTMLRAEQMARLLKGTDLPISAIAASVGWGDADFAARQFRRAVGVSPREFRRITRSTTLSRYPD